MGVKIGILTTLKNSKPTARLDGLKYYVGFNKHVAKG